MGKHSIKNSKLTRIIEKTIRNKHEEASNNSFQENHDLLAFN